MTANDRDTRPITPEQLHAAHRWVQLDELQPLPGNPNLGDETSLNASLDQFGWIDGIVVHDGIVLAGNHRVEAARARGETGLPAYDLTGIPIDAARRMAIALAHNETSRAGATDAETELEAFEKIARTAPAALAAAGSYSDPATFLDPTPVTLKDVDFDLEGRTIDVASFAFAHSCGTCGFEW